MTTSTAQDTFFLGAADIEMNKKQTMFLIWVVDTLAGSDVPWLIIIIYYDETSEVLEEAEEEDSELRLRKS